VHRVRHGGVDLPASGCPGQLGCFRVLWFADQADGARAVSGGDGWVLAVEFGPVPRAWSVLATGQSARPDSPFHADQVERFATGRLKPVAFTEADIARDLVRRYRPD
jgi:acyl-homoserine-lactone acylase